MLLGSNNLWFRLFRRSSLGQVAKIEDKWWNSKVELQNLPRFREICLTDRENDRNAALLPLAPVKNGVMRWYKTFWEGVCLLYCGWKRFRTVPDSSKISKVAVKFFLYIMLRFGTSFSANEATGRQILSKTDWISVMDQFHWSKQEAHRHDTW